ncbi:MAG TPA: molybdopterin-dependent oxidoreductase, partial [Bryobacteraceae bacterium]|nr:molybdopterin-dependent oxidoreductase [Bryobacteraceae bacterium]
IRDGLEDRDYIERHTLGFAGLKDRVREWTPDRAAQLTGIPAADIVELAREYATIRPAAIRLNYGVQRSERGAMAVRLVSLLPALTGAWRDAGGGIQLSTSYASHFNSQAIEMPELQLRSPLGRDARIINMAELGDALTKRNDPAIHALVVFNSNPAAIAPDQNTVHKGLRREDLFTVVLEQLQTDTADFADIILPATTFLENTDLHKPYGHYYLQLSRPALPPPGEARSNQDIFRALAARMGFTEPCFRDSDDHMIRAALSSGHPFLDGITLEALDQRHFIRLNVPDPFLPFAEGGFGTPSGKCEFHAETLDFEPPVESRNGDSSLRSRFPLELISPKGDNNVNSTFSSRPENDELQGSLTLHPVDAAARGIAQHDAVRVFNDRGECELKARIETTVAEGVVCVRSTRWPRLAPDRRGINMLTSQRLTDKGGGPTFYSCLVQVEKIA